MKLIYKTKQPVLVEIVKSYKMRKDDWITELYYKQLNGRSKNNNHTGKNVSSKKKISFKTTKPRSK